MKTWPKVKLGEVLTQTNVRVNVSAEAEYPNFGIFSYGRGLFRKPPISGASTRATALYRARGGQFVYSRLFAFEGAYGVVPNELDGFYVSNEFPLFDANPGNLVPEFLVRYLSIPAVWASIAESASGVGHRRQRVQPAELLCQEIPLPPLAEQRRVVARIEELAAQIHEARKLRAHVQEEAVAIVPNRIKEIFEHGLTAGWELGRLGDYVVTDSYGTSEKTSDDSSATPVLRMGNIQNGRLELRELKYLHISDREKSRLSLRMGDILVNRTNSAELVGKCAVFDLEGEYAFASYLIRLRLDTSSADPQLVASYINSPAGRAYMFSEKKQMTGQANVNATKLKALPIALPSLPDQRRIVAELDALQAEVEALKRHQAETAAELDALLPAILDRAFKGEL